MPPVDAGTVTNRFTDWLFPFYVEKENVDIWKRGLETAEILDARRKESNRRWTMNVAQWEVGLS